MGSSHPHPQEHVWAQGAQAQGRPHWKQSELAASAIINAVFELAVSGAQYINSILLKTETDTLGFGKISSQATKSACELAGSNTEMRCSLFLSIYHITVYTHTQIPRTATFPPVWISEMFCNTLQSFHQTTAQTHFTFSPIYFLNLDFTLRCNDLSCGHLLFSLHTETDDSATCKKKMNRKKSSCTVSRNEKFNSWI